MRLCGQRGESRKGGIKERMREAPLGKITLWVPVMWQDQEHQPVPPSGMTWKLKRSRHPCRGGSSGQHWTGPSVPELRADPGPPFPGWQAWSTKSSLSPPHPCPQWKVGPSISNLQFQQPWGLRMHFSLRILKSFSSLIVEPKYCLFHEAVFSVKSLDAPFFSTHLHLPSIHLLLDHSDISAVSLPCPDLLSHCSFTEQREPVSWVPVASLVPGVVCAQETLVAHLNVQRKEWLKSRIGCPFVPTAESCTSLPTSPRGKDGRKECWEGGRGRGKTVEKAHRRWLSWEPPEVRHQWWMGVLVEQQSRFATWGGTLHGSIYGFNHPFTYGVPTTCKVVFCFLLW